MNPGVEPEKRSQVLLPPGTHAHCVPASEAPHQLACVRESFPVSRKRDYDMTFKKKPAVPSAPRAPAPPRTPADDKRTFDMRPKPSDDRRREDPRYRPAQHIDPVVTDPLDRTSGDQEE